MFLMCILRVPANYSTASSTNPGVRACYLRITPDNVITARRTLAPHDANITRKIRLHDSNVSES
jgi:hypothetical protein